jgi:hypothetical protein
VKQLINSVVLSSLILVWVGAQAQDRDKSDTNQMPKRIMDGLKAKFPRAEVDKWTKEKEDDNFIYDIEFKQGGQKFEADIKEDGTIYNWEKAIADKDLPAAVRKAVEKKYPKASMKEIMEITTVKNGRDELEGYEIVLKTGGKKDVEVTVAPDGTILEDSGEKK